MTNSIKRLSTVQEMVGKTISRVRHFTENFHMEYDSVIVYFTDGTSIILESSASNGEPSGISVVN